VKPVAEFHDDHPDVIGHGEDHLSHVLGFLLFGAAELHLADLGDPVHDVGGFLAEETFDLAQFCGCVLDVSWRSPATTLITSIFIWVRK